MTYSQQVSDRPRLAARDWLVVLVAGALLLVVLVGCERTAGSAAADSPATSDSPSVTRTPETSVPLTDAIAGFIAIGDFGGGEGQQSVADQMLRWKKAGHRVDAIVTVGDNVYDHGEPSKFADQLERPYAPLGVPMYIALGNHDIDTRGGRPELDHLNMPTPPSKVNINGVEVFFLNSNEVNDSQASWLSRELAASKARARVVSFHHPAFSCGAHKSTKKVDEKWVPVIDQADPDLVLNGHDHSYQRFSHGGVTYVVTGGGGRSLTPVNPACKVPLDATLESVATIYEFVAFELKSGGGWRMTTVDATGAIIDRVER